MREVFNQLTNRDETLIDADEIVYFRDIYDHVIRLTDELDNYRELASATLDVYLTQVNNNLSVIMKRLTGVTVILAGIGAVAGIFGMSEAGAARCSGGEASGFWLVTAIVLVDGGRRGRRPAPDRLDLSRLAAQRLALDGAREGGQARAASNGVARSTSAAARTSSGIPCGPVTATARPSSGAGVPCRAQHREPVGVAAVVAEGHDRRRSSSARSASNASRLPPAVRGRRSTTSRPR